MLALALCFGHRLTKPRASALGPAKMSVELKPEVVLSPALTVSFIPFGGPARLEEAQAR